MLNSATGDEALIAAALIVLTGIFVGRTGNILALLLATVALVSIFGIGSLWAGVPTHDTLGFLLVAWISLQCGYMIGLTSRGFANQLLARFNGTQSKRV